MKLVFISNFFNHHQKPLSDEFFRILGDDYRFISTTEMPQERLRMGYPVLTASYIRYTYNSKSEKEECINLINSADVVIFGSASPFFLKKRKKEGKLIFLYSERLFRKGFSLRYLLPRFIKWNWIFYNVQNCFLLCASAYAAYDYNLIGLFKGKTYKWGYFTQVVQYDDLDSIIKKKKHFSILWAGRFLRWKHPEYAIQLVQKLLTDGYEVELNIIGSGTLESEITDFVVNNGLSSYINLLGSKPPDEVRNYMEKSEIFIFTSDQNEGWGAVLNESMNSACAVVANGDIGAVPFMIQDGVNGLVYKNGDFEDFVSKVKMILDDEEKRKLLQINAYKTMIDIWNPKVAAERFVKFSESVILCGIGRNFDAGPCSVALPQKRF